MTGGKVLRHKHVCAGGGGGGGGGHGNKAEHGAATLQLRLCGNCTLRDGWLSPRLSCCGQAADWLQGDDTHANAVPPAHISPSAEIHKPEKEKEKKKSRGDPHGWPQK